MAAASAPPSPFQQDETGKVRRNSNAWTETPQGSLQTAGSVGVGLYSMATTGFRPAAISAGLMNANPKARMAQMRADKSYLQNARALDALEGIPNATAKASEVSPLSRSGQQIGMEHWALGAELVKERYLGDAPVAFTKSSATRGTVLNLRVKVASVPPYYSYGTPSYGTPSYGTPSHGASVSRQTPAIPEPPELQLLKAQKQGFDYADEIKLLTQELADRANPPGLPTLLGRAARDETGFLIKRLGKGALGVGAGAGLLYGMNAARKEISEAIRESGKERAYRNAINSLLSDMSQSNPSNVRRLFEEDPRAAHQALRPGFDLLYRYAPDVVADPILTSQYLQRLSLDPRSQLPPEEYMRQVRDVVSLQKDLAAVDPHFATGPGAILSKLMG